MSGSFWKTKEAREKSRFRKVEVDGGGGGGGGG